MNLLAITTSHKTGALGLIKNNIFVKKTEWENEKSHAELITIKIEESLREHNLETKDINYFCVNIGPGSFTGLRISINAIKSFAFVHRKPILTMNSLELIAYSCSADKPALGIAVNAHSGLCYYAEFCLEEKKFWKMTGPIEALPFSEVLKKTTNPNMIFAGDGFDFYAEKTPQNTKILHPKHFSNVPRAEVMCSLAMQRISSQEHIGVKTWETLEPFYVRASAPEEKLDQSVKKN